MLEAAHETMMALDEEGASYVVKIHLVDQPNVIVFDVFGHGPDSLTVVLLNMSATMNPIRLTEGDILTLEIQTLSLNEEPSSEEVIIKSREVAR